MEPAYQRISSQFFMFEKLQGRNFEKLQGRNNSLMNPTDFSKVSLSPDMKNLIVEKRKKQKKFRGLEYFSQLNPTSSENFTRIASEMTEETHKIILEGLKDHFLFYHLSDDILSSLIKSMFPCSLNKDTYLFKQGDNASHFFFLEIGVLQIYINNCSKKELWPGTAFGELALIYNAVRSASIKALDDSILWCLDRVTFSNFFKEINERLYKENRIFLENISFFRFLTDQQKDTLALNLSKQCFMKNDSIINQGDIATSFYIIMEGSVVVYVDNIKTQTLKEGNCFGESTLLLNISDIIKGTVMVESPSVVCLAIGVTSLRQMFGENLEKMALKYLLKLAFEKHDKLSLLTEMQKYKIIDIMTLREIEPLKPICFDPPTLSVLLEGDLIDSEGFIIRKNGEIYGDFFLLDSENPYKKEIFLKGKHGLLSEVTIEQFKTTLNYEKFNSFILENSNSHENSRFFLPADSPIESNLNNLLERHGGVSSEENKSYNCFSNLVSTPILSTIEFIHKIKEGQMGLISLVMNNEKEFYIMKSYQTSWLSKFKSLSNYVQNEDEVVKFCNFPFIMDYYKSRQENDYSLLLVKYVKGIDLFEVLRQLGLLEIPQAKFYMGCLILTLQYLHQHHIIYRDLKPDNIMVDTAGYTKLIDMGTAKFIGRTISLIENSPGGSDSLSFLQQIKSAANSQVFDSPLINMSKLSLSPIKTIEQQNNEQNSNPKSEEMKKSVHFVRTFTIIGTPHYMAPEIITGQGYSFPVDYWALGIILYEFLCGYVPFGDDMEDPYEIYEKIVKKAGKVKYPNYMPDSNARKLISQLLNKSPDARLGGSFAALKNHAFFHCFDWNNLLNQKIIPPFLPLEGVDFVSEKELKKKAMKAANSVDIMKYLEVEHERIKNNLII